MGAPARGARTGAALLLLVLLLPGCGADQPMSAPVARADTAQVTTLPLHTDGDGPQQPPRDLRSTSDSQPAPDPQPAPRASAPALTAPAPSAAPSVTAAPAPRPATAPARLVVPAAGIDEPMSPSGLSARGTIDPAQGTLNWFTGYDRVTPGTAGTAVVSGHVSYQGTPDVFSRLDRVTVGDEVELVDADGAVQAFTVTTVEVVDKGDLQRDARVWGDQDEAVRLVLITCDDELGFRSDGHRAANLVVFATPTT